MLPEEPEEDGLAPGDIVDGRYRVQAVLASGAMGVVYVAQHISLGRKVALKVLRRTLGDRPDLQARFEQEARAASAIGHPSIVDVFDLGRCADGRPYMAMELLSGMTLEERLARDGTLPWPEVVELGAQLLSALAAAHERGIVHRDLKPENLFIVEHPDRPPLLKVVDFGISKISHPELRPASPRTAYGSVMGTAGYMSPEQARGQTTLVDHRTDLYAAGVVLYEALSGQPPFGGDSYNAILAAILEHRFEPLDVLRADVPAALVAVVHRALQPRREARFASAVEMREALLAVREVDLPVEVEVAAAAPPAPLLPETLQVVALDRWESAAVEPEPPPPVVVAPRPPPVVLRSAELATVGSPRPDPGARRQPETWTHVAAPPPRRRSLALPLLVAGAVAAAAAGVWLFAGREEPAAAPPPELRLDIQPQAARVTMDGDTLRAAAEGYITVEHHLPRGATEVSLRLPHALPLVEEADLAALPGDAPPPAADRDWERVDRALTRLDRYRDCLGEATHVACAALLRTAQGLGVPASDTDRVAELYVQALAALRATDLGRTEHLLRASLWAERWRLDLAELALLAPRPDSDDWRLRRALVAARAGLRPGAERARLAALTALEPFAAARDLVSALQKKKGMREAYNRVVRASNARVVER